MSEGRRARRRRRLGVVLDRVRAGVRVRGFVVVEEACAGSRVRLDLLGRTRASVLVSNGREPGEHTAVLVVASRPGSGSTSIETVRGTEVARGVLEALDLAPDSDEPPVTDEELRELLATRSRVPLEDRREVLRSRWGADAFRSLVLDGGSVHHLERVVAFGDPAAFRFALAVLRDLDARVPLEWVARRVTEASA